MGGTDMMVYGANGYTGRLLVDQAVRSGLKPVVAGRNAAALEAMARQHGLQWRVFGLQDSHEVAAALSGVGAVIHCAGPFSATSAPMVQGCLKAGAHYLDITGEMDVLEQVYAQDANARDAGVCLVPAVGFDVVPTDCLAARLAQRMPDATHLMLAFHMRGGATSKGTATTAVENIATGSRARVDGVIRPVPFRSRMVEFTPGRPRPAALLPWGDVSSAYRSTGIGNVEVYLGTSALGVKLVGMPAPVRRLLGLDVSQRLLKAVVARVVKGPNAEQRRSGRVALYGEVRNAAGATLVERMEVPEGYGLTVQSALLAAQRVMDGQVAPGAYTPSQAFGADFVLEVDGVKLEGAPAANSAPGTQQAHAGG